MKKYSLGTAAPALDQNAAELGRESLRNRQARPDSTLGRLSEGSMSNSVSKAIVAGLASLSLAASVFALTEPVSAQQWHGGGGGWHGGGTGGWHGASVRGWRGGAGGWHYGGYWHRGYRRGGNWYNGWWDRESVPASCSERLAAYPYYGAPYGYYACWQSRSTYSASGVYLGYQMVNVCQ